MTKALKKQEIIDHAYELFYDHGFHATGVDKVMADTGISKRTLYKYFASKEDLIAELIGHYGERFLSTAPVEIARLSPDPAGRVMALFDFRKAMFDEGSFRGCFAISANLEYSGRDTPVQAASLKFFETFLNYIKSLCADGGYKDPDKLAGQVIVLFNGAVVASQASRSPAPFDAAKSVLAMLLAAAK
jgi:AcrR family transcriptional regulator